MEFVEDRKKQLLSVVLMLGLMLATFVYVFKDENPANIIRTIESIDVRYFIIGLLLMIVYITCEGINIHLSMKTLTKSSNFFKSVGYAFVGFYFSSITPSSTGGQPAQVYYMKKDKIKISHSTLTLIIILVTHQLVLLGMALVMFLMDLGTTPVGLGKIKYLIAYGIIANALIVALMIALMYSAKTVEKIAFGVVGFLHKVRIIKNTEKINASLKSMLNDYEIGAEYIRKNPMLLVKVTLVTIVQVTAMYSVPYVVYRAFGLSGFTFGQLIYAQAILNLAVSSLPLPGSVGASETSFLKMFGLFFGQKLLMPGMLLTRILSFYMILIISGVISMALYIHITRKVKVANMAIQPEPEMIIAEETDNEEESRAGLLKGGLKEKGASLLEKRDSIKERGAELGAGLKEKGVVIKEKGSELKDKGVVLGTELKEKAILKKEAVCMSTKGQGYQNVL